MATRNQARHLRDGARFLALPHVVLECDAYKTLTGHQIKLLVDIAMQLTVNYSNNGRLSASWRYLSEEREWKSKDTIRRSLTVLENRGLIFCTRKGRLPNLAAWYAVTWHPLHHDKRMDVGPQSLPRGEYFHWRAENEAPCPKNVLKPSPISPNLVLAA